MQGDSPPKDVRGNSPEDAVCKAIRLTKETQRRFDKNAKFKKVIRLAENSHRKIQNAKAIRRRPAKDAMCKAIRLTKETQRRFALIKTQYSRRFTLIKRQHTRRFALQKILKAIRLDNGTIFKAMCLAVVNQGDKSC